MSSLITYSESSITTPPMRQSPAGPASRAVISIDAGRERETTATIRSRAQTPSELRSQCLSRTICLPASVVARTMSPPPGGAVRRGARYVCRFNQLSNMSGDGLCSAHGTAWGGRFRGQRQVEVYYNTVRERACGCDRSTDSMLEQDTISVTLSLHPETDAISLWVSTSQRS